MKERIKWLDVFKGIGIIFVVIGHARVPTPISTYIYSFHLPLFFFASGFIFKKKSTFSTHFIHQFKKIIVPYLIFSSVSYIYNVIALNTVLTLIIQKPITVDYIQPIIGIVTGNSHNGLGLINIALWFLPVLFFVKVLLFFVPDGKFKKIYHILILFLVLIIAIIFNSEFKYLNKYYNFTSILWGYFFALLGYFATRYKTFSFELSKFKKMILVLIFLVVNVFFSIKNGRIDMNYSVYGNYFFFLISAISGILTYLLVSKLLDTSSILKKFGTNSLLILSLHTLLLGAIELLLSYFIFYSKLRATLILIFTLLISYDLDLFTAVFLRKKSIKYMFKVFITRIKKLLNLSTIIK